MKITKLGHSCLLVEEKSLRILTDPGGTYFTVPKNLTGIDIILITHEHPDHYNEEVLKELLKSNPGVKVFTNKGVGLLLTKTGIDHSLVQEGDKITEKGVDIEVIGSKHAIILPEIPLADNTGYLISNRLFVSGDALTIPTNPVEILALPVAGPWLRLSDAVEYAKKIKPKFCFPIHEAIIKEDLATRILHMPQKSLEPLGIKYVVIEAGKTADF
jgi:L-ascorbate metabolism protein UlaG (beta-lactamase superfamily)